MSIIFENILTIVSVFFLLISSIRKKYIVFNLKVPSF